MSELEARIAQQAAEIDMLRGVDCLVDGDGPCGCCIKCLRQRAEAAEARVAEMEGQLASCADLANSWARETGITEAVDESGLKDLIDRLWAAWSSRYFGQRANYEEALAEGRAALAESERSRAELQEEVRRLESAPRDWGAPLTKDSRFIFDGKIHSQRLELSRLHSKVAELQGQLEEARRIVWDKSYLPKLDHEGGCGGCETGWCQSAVDAVCAVRNQIIEALDAARSQGEQQQ